jgi:hypothetical protein
MKHPPILTLLWCAGAAASASGQVNTFEFVVSNVVSPEQPSATVEVWAVFEDSAYAFCRGAFNVVADADPGTFSAPERILDMPGSMDGEVANDGDAVLGIVALQFNCHPFFADMSNPVLLWRATWSTEDFSQRSISVSTMTVQYDLYTWDNLCNGESFLDQFVEGTGTIHVVPGPAPGALLLVGPLAWLRRAR